QVFDLLILICCGKKVRRRNPNEISPNLNNACCQIVVLIRIEIGSDAGLARNARHFDKFPIRPLQGQPKSNPKPGNKRRSLLRPHLTEIVLAEGTALWSSRGSTIGFVPIVWAGLPDTIKRQRHVASYVRTGRRKTRGL